MAELTFVIIDNDPVAADIQRLLLEKQGYEVQVGVDARIGPDDVLLIDIDVLEAAGWLRRARELRGLGIIALSGGRHPGERDRALALGADGLIVKPADPATFVDEVLALADDRIDITYWGLRGILPVPGRRTLRYGGNTSCVSLELPHDQLFIFDAGSGLLELSRHLMATKAGALSAKIFISHPHSDHVCALPHFTPLHVAGNEFEILGPAQGALTMAEMVAAQMDGIYGPTPLRPFAAQVDYRDLSEEEFAIGEARVGTLLLAHPGNCLAYRVALGRRLFCFVTDNELHPKGLPGHDEGFVAKLTDFVRGADIVLADVAYTDEVYKDKVNWGHSCTGEAAALAHAAGVKELQLMQHAPEQTDEDIDAKLAEIRAALDRLESPVICTAPAEFTRRRMTASGALIELPPIEG